MLNRDNDQKNSVPSYLNLYDKLRREIVSEVYRYGEKLPSKRNMAADAGVSVITVEHAYELLADEGYIETRERSGYFVIYRKADFQRLEKNVKYGEESIDEILKTANAAPSGVVTAASDSQFPFTVLSKAMRRVLQDYGERILERSPNRGCTELRTELARYLERSRGISVTPEQIIVGSGAEYLYGLIVQLFGTDVTYALEQPSYGKIRQVYEALGARCDMLKLEADGISTETLNKTDARVLHVTPFNSYPSGTTISITKKNEYIHWAKLKQGYIIEDNYDSEMTVSKKYEDTVFSMSGGENVIYLNTFTKTIAPSIRIGYMVLPEALLMRFNNKLGFYACTVPVYEQLVLAGLLKNGDFERHINRVRRKRRSELKSKNK